MVQFNLKWAMQYSQVLDVEGRKIDHPKHLPLNGINASSPQYFYERCKFTYHCIRSLNRSDIAETNQQIASKDSGSSYDQPKLDQV